jgi:hypothetical protein
MEVLHVVDRGLLPDLLPTGVGVLQRKVRLERLLRDVLLQPVQPRVVEMSRRRRLRSGARQSQLLQRRDSAGRNEVRRSVLPARRNVRRSRPRSLLSHSHAAVQGRQHRRLLQDGGRVLLLRHVLSEAHTLPAGEAGEVQAVPEGREEVWEDVLHQGRNVLQRQMLLGEREVLPIGHLLQEGREVLRRDMLPRECEVLRRSLLSRPENLLRRGLLR